MIFILSIRPRPPVPAAWCFSRFSLCRSRQFAASFPSAGMSGSAQRLEQRWVQAQEGTPRLGKPDPTSPLLRFWPVSAQNQHSRDVSSLLPSLACRLRGQREGGLVPGFAAAPTRSYPRLWVLYQGFRLESQHKSTVGRLTLSVSLWLFSVHDKTMWKGSTQAKGRVRRNKIPYLMHA